MNGRLTSFLVAAVLSAALRPAAGAAAEAPLPVVPGVRAAVEVTALDLDVVVTKNGTFVNDLRREDFVVKVDGKPVPLDYFTKVEEGQLFGPDLSNASPDLILDTYKASSGDRYLARQFLLFFDDEHMMPFDRPRAIEGARDLVTRLSPSDQAALISYNRGSSRVLVPFTNSKESLFDGLSRLGNVAPGGLTWDSSFQQSRREALAARTTAGRESAIRVWSQQVDAREKSTLADLRRAVSALAARSGKRIFLYISSGLELRPGQSFAQAVSPRLLQQFEYTVIPEYETVVREANSSGVTMYALDARGLATDVDAGEALPTVFNTFFVDANRREAMAGFAAETGGDLFENRNRFKTAVDQVVREASSFYSVGVTLSNLPKKEAHKIDVAVTRAGVTVRTRRGFVPKSAEKATLDRMEMALLTPDARGDFPVELSIGAPKPGGAGRRLSPFEVRIPVSALTFRDVNGRKEASFELSIAAVEDTGARSEPTLERKTISIDAAAWDPAKAPFYIFAGEAKSRKGNHRFVATVKDVATSRFGIGSASARID